MLAEIRRRTFYHIPLPVATGKCRILLHFPVLIGFGAKLYIPRLMWYTGKKG